MFGEYFVQVASVIDLGDSTKYSVVWAWVRLPIYDHAGVVSYSSEHYVATYDAFVLICPWFTVRVRGTACKIYADRSYDHTLPWCRLSVDFYCGRKESFHTNKDFQKLTPNGMNHHVRGPFCTM